MMDLRPSRLILRGGGPLLALLLASASYAAEPAPGHIAQFELCWLTPAANTNGTALDDLSGVRVYWGHAPGEYTQRVRFIPSPAPGVRDCGTVWAWVLGDMYEVGTVYVAATAVDRDGNESAFSNEVTREFEILPADGTPMAPVVAE